MSEYAATDLLTTDEHFIIGSLKKKGIHVYPPSEQFTAKERIRAAITYGQIDWGIISRNPITKKAETYAQFFERIYGEAFDPETAKGKKR